MSSNDSSMDIHDFWPHPQMFIAVGSKVFCLSNATHNLGR